MESGSAIKTMERIASRIGLCDSAKSRNDLWKADFSDLVLMSIIAGSSFILWTYCSVYSDFSTVYMQWDGPNYIFVADTLFSYDRSNPWTNVLHLPNYYFACHLPGFPFAVWLVSSVLHLRHHLSALLVNLLTSIGNSLLMRRLLILLPTQTPPTFGAFLLSFLPPRLFLYRSTVSSEPLFLLFVLLTFIFLETDNLIGLFASLFFSGFTRIESAILIGSVGLTFLLRLDIRRAFVAGCSCSSFVLLSIFHRIRFSSFLAYFKYNSYMIGKPLSSIPMQMLSRSPQPPFSGYVTQLLLSAFMASTVAEKSKPIGIFCFAYVFFISCLIHEDVFRYAIPCHAFGYVIGLDFIWRKKQSQKAAILLAPLIIYYLTVDACGSIQNNQPGKSFTAAFKKYL